ncbi:MAG: hypothetical protein LBV16_09275 [Elusimicrobiota bacterium]|jgi:hypothetical protein|nr:hypothetical protein [Elusimicrobiota bacterium]
MKKVYLIFMFAILIFAIGSCSTNCDIRDEEEATKLVSFSISSPDSVQVGETIEIFVNRYEDGVFVRIVGNGYHDKIDNVAVSPTLGAATINVDKVIFTATSSGNAVVYIYGDSGVAKNDYRSITEFDVFKAITIYD